MSTRFKFLLSFAFIFTVTALLLSAVTGSTSSKSGADKPADGSVVEGTNGKMRRYANEVIRIEPDNFAVTPRLRDLPDSKSYAPDAFRKGGQVIRERRMARLRQERAKKGLPPMTAAEEQDIQLNWRNAKKVKKPLPGEGAGFAEFVDPVLNVVDPAAPQAMPTPSLTFDGAGQADNSSSGAGTGFTPPDVNGDVGPNHYVSSVNLSIKIFNKDGTVAAAAKKTSDLFASLPSGDPCRSRNDGDPIVLYDSLADRWFITQFSIPGGDGVGTNNYECVAVSQTADPTGSYYVWSYQYPNSLFNDYPKVGIWTDAYHMTFNQFTNAGAWAGLGILSQDRAKALAGDPNTTVVYKDVSPIDPNAGGALPADIDGFIPPPAGMAQVIAEFRANEFGDPNDAVRLYRWIPDFATPANSTFTTLGDTVLAAFDARSPNVTGGTIEQAGGTALDGIAERLMFRLAYRNLGTYSSPVNSYAGSFTVNVSGVNPTTVATYQTGIRWFELRRTNDTFSVRDQGTHATGTIDGAAGLNNWMSSIAQDNAGNIALGFSQASSTQNADIKIAGRTGTSTGAGLNEGEALFWDALGSQNGTSERWGDYSMMSVDPTDDCTFWYTQQYYATSSASNWSTRVGKFKYPGCNAVPKGTVSGTITSCATGQPISAANVLATGGFHRLTGTLGTYSMTVYPGNYTISADKGIGLTGSSVPVSVTSGGTSTANICLTGLAVANAGEPSITSESCGISNGKPDPGEQLTVALPITNTGGASTSNLVATLQATGGVVASTSQSYGVVAPGDPAVSRNFTFTISSSQTCGSSVTLTWVLTDGATNLGTVTKTYSTGAPVTVLSQNFDSVTAPALPASWTSAQTSGTGINWVTSTTSPVSSSPNTAFANGPGTVNAAALVTPAITITTAPASLTFKKAYNMENGYDGAVLEIKIGTGAWQDIITAGGSFVTGGYISAIDTGYQSPIGGRSAWTGSSTTMSNTEVTLPSSATGQSVQLRWLVATDNSTTSPGFRVDDIAVNSGLQCQSCSASNGSLAGTVRYYGGTQPAVPGVTLTGAGTPQTTTTSASNGTYTLSGLGSSAYTVTPSKTGDVSGIASADAARVAQAVVGLVTLTANQQIAADATANGTVSSADAARIAQYIVGLNPTGATGTWKFSPANKSYTSVTSAVTGEDYAAIMVGDVTGNWTAPPAASISAEESAFPLPKRSAEKASGLPGLFGQPMYSPLGERLDITRSGRRVVDVSLTRLTASDKDGTVTVPVKVGELSGMNITSFDFALRYDARALQPVGVTGSGALAENFLLTPNFNVPGSIRISGFGIDALSGSGDLVYIVFKVRTRVNPRQPVTWQSFIFNEGEIPLKTRISTDSNGTGRNRVR